MAIYHAGKNGSALCGQSGMIGGFYACTITPSGWNKLPTEKKCKKCVAKIKATK